MSTLPRDTSDSANAAPLISTEQSEPRFDAVVSEFEAAAEEVGMARPSGTELRDLCRQVADLAVRLFPGDVRSETRTKIRAYARDVLRLTVNGG